VIIAQGGRFGGWTLYMKGGKLKYCYNWLDRERYTIASTDPLPAGKATVEFDFKYDGGGVGKGGTGALYVNDQKVAEGRIEHTIPFIFSADETEDLGEDVGTPVTEDYKEGDNTFTAKSTKDHADRHTAASAGRERRGAPGPVIDEGIN
jgi:arylsulfatase